VISKLLANLFPFTLATSTGCNFVNGQHWRRNKNVLSQRVLIFGKRFGHIDMINEDSFYPSKVNSEDSHFPHSAGSRFGSIARLCEVIRLGISSKERESVPQDGVNNLWAALVSTWRMASK